MPIKRISYYTFIVFLLSLPVAHAQPKQGNYVIMLTGDTIKCEFSSRFWGRIRYRLNKEDGYKKIDAVFIKEYHVKNGDETYRVLVLPNTNKLTFVRLIEPGKINLYELLVQGNKGSTKYWYACKDDMPVVEVDDTKLLHSGKRFRQNFSSLIQDDEMRWNNISNS
jgi:hypothetical protein